MSKPDFDLVRSKQSVARWFCRFRIHNRDIWCKIPNRKLYDNKAKYKAKNRLMRDKKTLDFRSKEL